MNSRDYNSYSSDNEDEVSYDADTETEDSSANYDTNLDENEDSDNNSAAEFSGINAGANFGLNRSHERFLNNIIFNSSNVFSDEDNESVDSTESARWREGEDYNDHHEELNEQLRESIEEGDHKKVEQILEEIDESRIDIDNDTVREAITENDDSALFEVIRYSSLAPSNNESREWIESTISENCSDVSESIIRYFNIDDEKLFEFIDQDDDGQISFYLRYVLRQHKDHPKFNAEIAKCIDLLKKDDVELRIATALCYESQRHPEDSLDCKIRRDLLKVFDPELATKPIAELASYLKSQETAKHDYYGSNLSDDSDSDLSDSEIAMGENLSLGQLTNKANLTGIVQHLKSIINGEEVAVTEKNLSSKFPPNDFSYTASEKAKADLATLNRKYEQARNQGKVAELLNSLDTKFSLLHFRGLSYYTTHWSQPARRHHRNLDEVGHAQFASASLQAAGIAIDDLRDHTLESIEKKATPHANKIINFKRKLEDEENFYDPNFRDRKFSNALYFFHELYTDKYDRFPGFLRSINSGIRGNPLASTGETPRHPFNYALGVKIYEGHENKRLRPRHNNERRCERPHSGKVYFINLPLAELASTAMVSVPILNYKAEIVIDNLKIAEREAAFWGMIKGEWIIGQSSARYPSFDKKYKPKYFEKYGLNKEAYTLFSTAFESFAPHTNENKLCKLLLGTYLSAFYEQKAMRYCIRSIGKKTQPVFLGMDGKFSFKLGPYTPFVNGANNQISREAAKARRTNKQIDLKDVKSRKLDFSK